MMKPSNILLIFLNIILVKCFYLPHYRPGSWIEKRNIIDNQSNSLESKSKLVFPKFLTLNNRLMLNDITTKGALRLHDSYFIGRQKKRNTTGFADRFTNNNPWPLVSKQMKKADPFVLLSNVQKNSTLKMDTTSNQLSSEGDTYLSNSTEPSLITSTETVNTTNMTQDFEVTQMLDLESDISSLGWQIKVFNYVKNLKFNQTWSSFNYTMANMFMNLVDSEDHQNWIKNNIWLILSCLLIFITIFALFMLCYQTTLSEYFKWSKKSKRSYTK